MGSCRSTLILTDKITWQAHSITPVVLVCDNICYVKKHPIVEELMINAECGCPYEGCKEYYILDIDHATDARRVVSLLETVTEFPKKRG